jgi:hypothetical protein
MFKIKLYKTVLGKGFAASTRLRNVPVPYGTMVLEEP